MGLIKRGPVAGQLVPTCMARTMAATVFVVLTLATGCCSIAKNVKSADDVKGRKVLAGRFVFYDGGRLVKPKDAPMTINANRNDG
jgi:hypothetical protein